MIDVPVANAGEAAPSIEIQSREGVAKYLASAERMRGLADVVLKVGIVLILLLLIAWVLGLLPGAVRLF